MSDIPGLAAVTEQDVLINGETFKAITAYSVNQQATIPKHKMQDGFQLADHMFLENVGISLTLKLFKELNEREKIDDLYQNKTQLTIYSELGSYDNVVISSLKVDRGDALNTYIATVGLEQIRIGTAAETSTSLPASVSKSNLPGSTSAKTPSEKEVDDPAEATTGDSPTTWHNGSWYDMIFGKAEANQ